MTKTLSQNKVASKSAKASKIGKQIGVWVATILLFAVAIIMLIPIYYIVVSTFKTAQEVTFHPLSFPAEWHFDRYVSAWNEMHYPRALLNTLIVSIPSVTLSTLFSAAASYAIVRCPNAVNRLIYKIFIAGLLIPGNVSLIALYKLMQGLHLNNSLLGLIVLGCSGVSLMSIFLLKNFLMSSVTIEIEEAADVDGCGVLRKFFVIVLPLLRPVLATNMIISLVGVWNDYMNPALFLQDDTKYTLLLEVYQNVGQFSTDWLTMFNMLVLGIAPLTLLFLILQKHIIAGVAAGAVKG